VLLSMRLGVDRRVLLVVAVFVLVLCVCGSGVGSARAAGAACANEQLRAEQPYGLALPDCRAYEMVSPVEKNDGDAVDSTCFFGAWSNRASVSGEAIAFVSPTSYANPVGARLCDTYKSKRGPGGWSTENITPPHEALEGFIGGFGSAGYKDLNFTPDLSSAVVTEQTVPLTSDTPGGSGPNEIYTSMYVADLTNRSYQLVESQPTNIEVFAIPQPVAATPDLSHVLLERMLVWVNGKTFPANVNNNGETLRADPGSGMLSSNSSGEYPLFSGHIFTWHAMSSDGKRVFMTSTPGAYLDRAGRESLYMRENPEQPQSPVDGQGHCTIVADACTVLISGSRRAVPDPEPNGPYPVVFLGASADGSKVFFRSRIELTEDAFTGAGDEASNLYEYDVNSETLKDLTVDTTYPRGGDLLGVVGMSEDGSYVYFVARGNLAPGATTGQANLYVAHEGGAPKFIATLLNGKQKEQHEEEEANNWATEESPGSGFTYAEGSDAREWMSGIQHPQEPTHAVVSHDGTKLMFISKQSLTGYDNERAEDSPVEAGRCDENGRCNEVFVYDTTSGSLVCASCNPSGARPLGPSDFDQIELGNTPQKLTQNLTESGTLFFETYDALVPHDSNGLQDVYEYQNGHVYPVSDVANGVESHFLNTGGNGRDVFIGTGAQLLPEDHDSRIDIYDARVNGGFPVNVVPPVCDNGDACKPPPSLQPGVFGAPASATFSGAGNVAPVPQVKRAAKVKAKPKRCKQGYAHRHGKCVRKKTGKSSGHSKRGK
jgi:hypothetical protein